MAEIRVRKTTVTKKNSDRPRKTLYLRRAVVNGQALKLQRAAARKRLVTRR